MAGLAPAPAACLPACSMTRPARGPVRHRSQVSAVSSTGTGRGRQAQGVDQLRRTGLSAQVVVREHRSMRSPWLTASTTAWSGSAAHRTWWPQACSSCCMACNTRASSMTSMAPDVRRALPGSAGCGAINTAAGASPRGTVMGNRAASGVERTQWGVQQLGRALRWTDPARARAVPGRGLTGLTW